MTRKSAQRRERDDTLIAIVVLAAFTLAGPLAAISMLLF
jgi:hypothetical protein